MLYKIIGCVFRQMCHVLCTQKVLNDIFLTEFYLFKTRIVHIQIFSLDIYGFNPTLRVSTEAYHPETVIIVSLS